MSSQQISEKHPNSQPPQRGLHQPRVSLDHSSASSESVDLEAMRAVDNAERKKEEVARGNLDEVTNYLETQLTPAGQDEEVPAANVPVASVGPPPNGGTLAWLQVVAGFFLFFNSWGIVNTFGVFQSYYQDDLLNDSSQSAISWIGSIQGFLVVNGSLVVGPLIDMGLAKHIVIIGTFVLTFGMMMTSLGTEYYQIILAQGVVVGIGCTCAFVPSVSVISSYFTTKRAFAMGICASGSSLGGVIYPIMAHKLIPRLGFPWTVRILGFMIFGSMAIAITLLKVRLPPRKPHNMVHWSSFKDFTFIILSLGIFFGFAGLYIPFFYAQSYAISIGVDPKFSFYLLSILNAGSIFGRIIPNFIADKAGPYNVIVWCSGCCAILLLCWIRVKNTAGLVVFCILYGFCSGAFVSIPPACIARITPDLGIIGARMGLGFFIISFGLLIGSPVAGAILKLQNETFWGAQLWAGLAMCMSFALCLVAKWKAGNGNLFAKV